MALYTETNGWINKVEIKSNKKGNDYAVVNICIDSKGKDSKGEFTITENNCYIYASVFSKKALELLSGFDKDKGLLCKLKLKLESNKKDDNYYHNWTLLRLEKITFNKPQNSTQEENIDTGTGEVTDAKNTTLSNEEKVAAATKLLEEQGITVNIPTNA